MLGKYDNQNLRSHLSSRQMSHGMFFFSPFCDLIVDFLCASVLEYEQ